MPAPRDHDRRKFTRCWDCGSTVKGRHTMLCEFQGVRAGKLVPLPAHPGTQWWTGELPARHPGGKTPAQG